MKKLSLSTFLFLISFFIIGQNSPFSTQANSTKQRNPDTISLPFFEDWSSGSLETNNWTTECENWVINDLEGNEEPSVEFTWDPHLHSGYSCSLVSDTLEGKKLGVGKIMLEFDVRLDNRTASGSEKLLVEVFDGTEWIKITEFANTDSIEWQSKVYNITKLTLKNNFQIRFNAIGENSYQIKSWFVDNISIYRVCEAPHNLEATQSFRPNDSAVIEVNWTQPLSAPIVEYNWLHWDDDEFYTGMGFTDGGDYSLAIRWDTLQMKDYIGDTISSLKFFIQSISFSQLIAKIWTGENADQLIFQKEKIDPEDGWWNEVKLDTIIIIEANTEYRVGYSIVEQYPDAAPIGLDNGPAKTGYGDLMYTNADGWYTLTSMGMSENINIRMKLLNSDTVPDCKGFNIYRMLSGDDTDYNLYDFVPYSEDMSSTTYSDTVDYSASPCYKVAAVWANEGDTCISDFALDIPEIDNFVCPVLWEVINQNANNQLTIYPNPAGHTLNISSSDGQAIEEVCLYNLTGQIVFRGEAQNNILDISGLPAGMYVIEVVLGSERIRQKLIVK